MDNHTEDESVTGSSDVLSRNNNMITTLSQREKYVRPRVNVTPKNIKAKQVHQAMKVITIGDSGCGKTSLLMRFSDNEYSEKTNCTVGLDFKTKVVKVDGTPIKLQMWDTAGQERFKSLQQNYLRNSHGCIAVYDITDQESFANLEEYIIEYLFALGDDEDIIDGSKKKSTAYQNFKQTSGVSSRGRERSKSFTCTDESEIAKISKVYTQQNDGFPRNVVLVGTKLDIVKNECQHSREVSFMEAVELANRLNLAGVVETSAKCPSMIEDINDCFRILVATHQDAMNSQEVLSTMPPGYFGYGKPALQSDGDQMSQAVPEYSVFERGFAAPTKFTMRMSVDTRETPEVFTMRKQNHVIKGRKQEEENSGGCC